MTPDRFEPSDEAWRLAGTAFGSSADEECAYRVEEFLRAGMAVDVILELCRRGWPSGWAADAWAEGERDIETLAGRAFIAPQELTDHVTNLRRAVHTVAAPSGHAVEYAIARASSVLTTIVEAGTRLVGSGAHPDDHGLEIGRLLRPSFRAQADGFGPRARHLVEPPLPPSLPRPSTLPRELFAGFARRDGFTERAIDIAYPVDSSDDMVRPNNEVLVGVEECLAIGMPDDVVSALFALGVPDTARLREAWRAGARDVSELAGKALIPPWRREVDELPGVDERRCADVLAAPGGHAVTYAAMYLWHELNAAAGWFDLLVRRDAIEAARNAERAQSAFARLGQIQQHAAAVAAAAGAVRLTT